MGRGYAIVGLHHPSADVNIGGALRAAACFGASAVAIQGKKFRRYQTDTSNAWKNIPVHHVGDLLFDAVPFACVPVAVEIVDGARDLPDYTHPDRAIYIFGPESGSLPKYVIEGCRDVVRIPGGCLNLAASVNVVLYDRVAKRESDE